MLLNLLAANVLHAFIATVTVIESHYVIFDGHRVGRYGLLVHISDGKAMFKCRSAVFQFDNLLNYVCRQSGYKRALVSSVESYFSSSSVT